MSIIEYIFFNFQTFRSHLGIRMIKKFVYCGLLLIAIAIIAFLAAGAALSGSMGTLPFKNITVPNDNFAYLLINTSDASTAIVSAALSSAINLYIFNSSDFNLWRQHVTGNSSVNGLRYAQMLYRGNSTFIFANTPLMMPENASFVLPKSELYNNSIYFVMDNTNGSTSSGKTVSARVIYLIMDSATIAKYRSLTNSQLYTGIAALIIFAAGVVIVIYGLLKKEAQSPSIQVPTGKKEANKDYIDSLYKNVSKGRRSKGNSQ